MFRTMDKRKSKFRRTAAGAALLLSALLFTAGCGADGKQEKTSQSASTATAAQENGSGENGQPEVIGADHADPETGEQNPYLSEQEQDLSGIDASQIIEFVDAHGNYYRDIIDESVDKHPYDTSLFVYDGDRVSYNNETYTSRIGVDVSEYNGEIDWSAVKEDGIEFAFIRIGYREYGEDGVLVKDSMFEQNYEGAREQGIDVGVYIFSQAINEDEAAQEARFIFEVLGGRELQLPAVYDGEVIEDDGSRTDTLTKEQNNANTRMFCDMIRVFDYEPAVYSNMLREAYLLDLSGLSDVAIWYADYESLPQTPYNFVFWQYSNAGTVSGIDGNVDLNVQILTRSVEE